MGSKSPASTLADGDLGTYDTAQAAAIAGLRSIKETTSEYGGGVLYNPGTKKYSYTQPVGQGDGSHFGARIAVPQGWQLDSIYHTHPKGPQSSVFSMDDVNMAQQLNKPSYILPLADNTIRKFDPSDSESNHVVRKGFDPSASYAPGVPIYEGPAIDGTPKAHPGTVLVAKQPTDQWGRPIYSPPAPASPPTSQNYSAVGSPVADPYAAIASPAAAQPATPPNP